MSITTTTRQASIDEIAAEMDRRGMVIEQLEARLAHIDGIDAGAIDNLHHHQRQLDADGIEVGVSRQALLEVLTGVEAALPALRAAPAGDVAEALNPDALAALKNGQRQLDQDGVEVGVSRQALDELIAAFEARTALSAQGWRTPEGVECHGLDTAERVCFYEQDFYVLSNFSSFSLRWSRKTFPTSEHAYHWEKFADHAPTVAQAVASAPSAHEAFKIAEHEKAWRRKDWDDVKVGIMRDILRAKAQQHEYVRRKLLATGNRELVENSWRDDFWGWGPNRDGQNMLGKLWMEIRAELRTAPSGPTPAQEGR